MIFAFSKRALSLAFCLSFFAGLSVSVSADPLKDNVALELGFIKRIFQTGYAPAEWKAEHFGWNLDKEYQKSLSVLDAKGELSAQDYRRLIAGLLTSVHDYHVGFSFYATEFASLPFAVARAGSRVFVTYVDTDKFSDGSLSVGDEILTWNGKPVRAELDWVLSQVSWGVPSTDGRLAELMLTRRSAAMTLDVPQGFVDLTFTHQGKVNSRQLSWAYVPESINWNTNNQVKPFAPLALRTESTLNSYMHPQMSWGMWDTFSKIEGTESSSAAGPSNPFKIGGKKTFVPTLGPIIWESAESDTFYAYIYRNSQNRLIGYVRITDYGGDSKRFQEFKKVIGRMENSTDALVLDETNNPGGSIFYVLSMMSVLSKEPIRVPAHQISLWPELVKDSVDGEKQLLGVTNDEQARKALGDDIDGFPVDFQFAQAALGFNRSVKKAWNDKVHVTAPLPLFGVDKVNPDKDVNYSKPILVLVNELDFSGGDFFPAILQDNQRAKIFGARTSGAGGYILQVKYPSNLGLNSFSFTGSIARRVHGEPIENLGVTPDISYDFTVRDLREGFVGYGEAVNKAIIGLL